MLEPNPPKKRLVSKPEYAAHLAKMTIHLSGAFVLVIGGIGFSVVILLDTAGLLSPFFEREWVMGLLGIIVILCGGLAGGMFLWGGLTLVKTAARMEEVLPRTPHRIEQLPARETLVRASSEPVQGQEKVLLRAATGGAETPPEQLLRPTPD